MAGKKNENEERPAPSVASPEENAALGEEVTDGAGNDFGVTTRDDKLDAGVPMAPPSDPDNPGPQGPEDALGEEPTRGDYTGRIDQGPHLRSVEVEPDDTVTHTDADGKPVKADSKDVAAVVREPGPRAKLVEQTPATPEG